MGRKPGGFWAEIKGGRLLTRHLFNQRLEIFVRHIIYLILVIDRKQGYLYTLSCLTSIR